MADRGIAGEIATAIGPVGVWSFALDQSTAAASRDFVAEIEELGYRALWIPESIGGKEVFSHAATLLAAGRRIVVASGIASIWARDPMAMSSGARNLSEAFPGRFLLGLGVSHSDSVEVRGHEYRTPYSMMRAYLDEVDRARYGGPTTPEQAPRVLAALGPKMLALAADRALGAHSYFVPPEHTAFAREGLGPAPLLAVEQTVVLETDPSAARRIARTFTGDYLELPNYANNLRRLGWSEEDVAGAGSDALVDAVIAWGDVEAVAARVRAHLDAGADHVCVQVIAEGSNDLCLRQLRELAPALLA